MAKARLMSRPEDFKKLGIRPDKVEMLEDGLRDTCAPKHNEVWYFDGQFRGRFQIYHRIPSQGAQGPGSQCVQP